jgi:hypothetical protein
MPLRRGKIWDQERFMEKSSPIMVVVFRRNGERRYGVEVKRPPFSDLEMSPAPGFDPLMPHDLMHLVVEAELNLTQGIYGQLSSGGDAGTFHPTVNAKETSREIARLRRRVKTRGAKLFREGRADSAQSERATYICWQAWLARSGSADRKMTGATMAQQAKEVRDVAANTELDALTPEKLDEICEHLDELSSYWSNLKVGQSMAVRWPDLAILPPES